MVKILTFKSICFSSYCSIASNNSASNTAINGNRSLTNSRTKMLINVKHVLFSCYFQIPSFFLKGFMVFNLHSSILKVQFSPCPENKTSITIYIPSSPNSLHLITIFQPSLHFIILFTTLLPNISQHMTKPSIPSNIHKFIILYYRT